MKKKLRKLIESFQTIIIHRHLRPDLDAIGSQMGLYHLIKTNYPEKEVYVVGDSNKFLYKTQMEDVPDYVFKNALSIILDTAVSELVSDNRYVNSKSILIIDHHQNESNIDFTLFYQKAHYTSACEIIIDLAREFGWTITSKAATYLYGGMVSDTGRFQYIKAENATRVFSNAAFITGFYPDISDLYDFLYNESLEERQKKNLFRSFDLTKHNVAYRKNTKEIIDESNLDIFSISRGMVNLMAGIKEVPIWVNFTEDFQKDGIIVEIRSRNIVVVDIAKKYGGGGHNFACGATINSWDTAELLLNELDERARENGDFSENI